MYVATGITPPITTTTVEVHPYSVNSGDVQPRNTVNGMYITQSS